MYWHQGPHAAPLIVQKCIESWALRNPSWQLNLLTSEDLHDVICLPELYTKRLELTLPALSDIIRAYLLARYGGVWADATTWCARSLDEWIEDIVSRSGFFAYARPVPQRPLSSWFLASFPQDRIITRLKIAIDSHWKQNAESGVRTVTDDPGSPDYYWFHKLFETLLGTDEEVAELWNITPQISAEAPHYLQAVGLANPATPAIEFHIRNKLTNVYKLSRRIELPDQIEGTVLDVLFRSLTGV
jgi:hypothetical protein